jgi:DnaJ-class molecular chaperone
MKADLYCRDCVGTGYIEYICSKCAGSGEGGLDLHRCYECKGKGIKRYVCTCTQEDVEPDTTFPEQPTPYINDDKYWGDPE